MIEYEISAKSIRGLGLKELWRYRELFYFFSWRDIKVKYKQTLLGFTWAIIQPLLMMLVFTLFFENVLNSTLPAEIPYPIFAFAGIMLWNVFSSGLTSSGNSMIANGHIIKKIYFPKLILPVSSILVSGFDFLMTLTVFAVLLVYYQIPVSFFAILVIPVALLFTMLGTFGLGTLIAALSVKYRDFRFIIPFLIQFLLFVTPVIYPETIVQHKLLEIILWLNPMTGPIHLFRAGLFGSPIELPIIIASLLSSAALIIAGLIVFKRTESYFADIA